MSDHESFEELMQRVQAEVRVGSINWPGLHETGSLQKISSFVGVLELPVASIPPSRSARSRFAKVRIA